MRVDKIKENQVKTIVDVLNPSKIQETCPVLLVGGAVTLFKHMYKGTVNELKNTEEVKEFIVQYAGIDSSKPVVISDIGYLTKNAAFLLLKLVEESSFPVILLSTIDKVDSILLSRIKRVIKFPKDMKSGNNFIPLKDAYDAVYGDEKKVNDKITYYAENCPKLYEIETKVPYSAYRNSIIEILGGCYGSK